MKRFGVLLASAALGAALAASGPAWAQVGVSGGGHMGGGFGGGGGGLAAAKWVVLAAAMVSVVAASVVTVLAGVLPAEASQLATGAMATWAMAGMAATGAMGGIMHGGGTTIISITALPSFRSSGAAAGTVAIPIGAVPIADTAIQVTPLTTLTMDTTMTTAIRVTPMTTAILRRAPAAITRPRLS
jgi:hypothetical protein